DTYSEIKQQPEMWQLTEEIIKDIKSDFDEFIKDIEKNATGKLKVLFTGAGSSAYVGDILRTAIDTKHMPKWDFESVPTTHFVTSPEAYIDSETTYLIVSFARSGNSPETKATIDLVEQLSDNVHHLFITNNKSGYLATE
ncbi:tagatose-6-phosphate ketose isomerase, partial [Salmonella sp. 3DZ2-4SM]